MVVYMYLCRNNSWLFLRHVWATNEQCTKDALEFSKLLCVRPENELVFICYA